MQKQLSKKGYKMGYITHRELLIKTAKVNTMKSVHGA